MYIGQCLLPDDKIKSLAKDLSEDTTLGLSYKDALSEIKDKFNVVFSKLKIPEEIWNEDFFEPYKDIVLNRVKDLITIDGALIDYNFINDPKLRLDINVFLANKLIESFNGKVREADDFKETHIYEIKQGDEWVKADISVTSYAKEIKDEKDLNKAKPFKISQYKKEDVVPNAGMVIGNTFDSIARDFFSGEDITKKSYPNIDSRRLKELQTELENVKTYFDKIYKGKYKVIARPFPIASTFTDSTGKKFTIAGETDLIVVTPNGIKIYDFKVNSSKSDIELVDAYTNQLSLYKRIINDEMPFLNVDTGGLIVADINYYKTRGILKIKDGIITYKDKNISSLKEEDYSIHLHQSVGFMQKSPIVTIMYNKKVIENIGRLSDEELEELKKIPMFGELDIEELSKKGKIEQKKKESNPSLNEGQKSKQWSRYSDNNYEVSSEGDERFSAKSATFKKGTIIDGVDVGGKTIEYVYQSIIKKSRKGQPPSVDSITNLDRIEENGEPSWIKEDLGERLPKDLWHKLYGIYVGLADSDIEITDADKEDFSYYVGYLPLWQEWAKQNPELIEELREKSKGKVLTDKFANTRVSQARALADILNATNKDSKLYRPSVSSYTGNITPDADTIFVFGSNPEGRHGAGAAKIAREQFGAIYGQGEGLQGNAYALPTKDLRIKKNNGLKSISPEQIIENIKKLYETARQNPDKQFKVAYRNTDKASLNGYTGLEMIDMFLKAGSIPSNIYFSKEWVDTGKFNLSTYTLNSTQENSQFNTTNITKIISGGQTGVDTIGLQVAKELGIETGGTAPKGFRRETGIDNEDIRSYNLVEITDEEQADYTKRKNKRDPYTGRTELNVRNSDGTVYFYTSNDKIGMLATQRSAKEWNKPFIVNPSVEQLRDWIIENNIKVLNVAGNRGSKLSKDNNVAEVLRKALTYSKESEDSTEEEEEIDNPFEGLLEEDNNEDTNEDDEELDGNTEEVSTIDTSPNLLPVTSTEIIKCGQNVAKLVAYHINILRADDNYREELFGDKFPEGYFLGKSNNEIVTDKDAFKAILDFIKDDTFNIEDIDFDSPLFDKVDWVLDNWDSVIKAGFSTFVDVLNISIDASVLADDETNNEDLNSDQDEDSSDDERAAWSYDIREVSPSKSMNANLKIQLCTIPEYSYSEGVDSNGNPVMIRESLQYDEGALNSVKFLDRNTIIYTLFNELHSFRRFSEMKAALGSFELQSKYPWMQDVYDLLDNNPDLETLFFTTFRTNKLNYINTSVQEIEQEKGTTLEINSYPLADNITFETILSQVSDGINRGESELFTINGNNGLSLLNSEENESLFSAYEHIKRPRKSDKSSKKVRMIRYIKRYCQSLGFNESFIEIISPALKKEKDSNLNNIVEALEQSRKSIAEKASTKRGFIPYVNFSREFYHIVKTIEPYYPIQNELSGYNNGKSYQTFVPPSYLGDLIDKLSNGTDDEIRAFIREEFGQSFQTAIFNKDGIMTGSPNYWLNEIYKNPELGRQMVHYVEVESQGKQYKDLTSAEYQLSLFINYLTPMGFPGTSKEELTRLKAKYKGSYARFRVPIMSDKSTSEYILFEKIPINAERDAEQMKKEICKALFPMFFTELMRIKHTFANNLDIENYNVPIPEDIKEKFENGKLTLKDFVTKDKKTGKPTLQSWVKGGLAFRNFDIIVPSFISNENKEFTKAILQIINSKNTTSATYNKSKQSLIDNFDKVLTEAIDNRLKTVFIPHLFSIGVDFSKIEKLLSVSKVSSEDLNNFLTEYYWNDFLASTCIQNMTIIDQAFYKDAVAIQKRMAQIHSMTTRPNTEATFIDDNGNRVRLSDGKQRVLIIEDEFSASSIAESVKTVFEGLAKDAENNTKREEYLKLSVEIPKKLSNINVTDGQALSTISGMFKKYGMLYGVSPSLKRAYDKIRTGHFDREDIEQFIDGYYSDYTTSFGIIKPFTFAKVNAGTAENPLIDNLQIKDSECMLALSGALLNTYSKKYLPESSPLRALYEIVEDSFYDEDGQWTGKGIDTIVFRSCVKMGSFKVLKDISKSADPRKDIREYLKDPHSIKVFDFDKWGKQQNTPDELRDHEQDMGSQERVLSVSDFDDSDVFTMKGNKKTLYRDFLKDYFKLLEEDFNDGIDNIIEKFKINNSYAKRVHKLSEYLKSQILKDSKFTFENFKAVSLNNGEFTIPIGDPSLSDKFLTSLYAEVKRNVNKEKMLGGPTVQVSCYGLEGLEIHINSKTKSLEYIDVAMTCPSDELEAKLTKPDGSLMSVEEALKKKLITEDDLKAIITRIPTEDKYSILPCRVKFFLPRHSGDRVIFPKEITYLTGSDFDVDKGYIQLKYTINNFGKLFETQRRKNKIFEYQWAALTHPKSFEKMIYGQDFGFLKDIAETIDPNFKSADINMSFAESQSYFMEKNMYAKKLVAISAVHNISHSIANFADLYIKIPDVSINGIRTSTLFDERDYFRIDKTYSDFNGSRISRTIASLLGAAVDNAKELIVATIGYNDMTANIFLTMVRAGIPIDFVCYLFANKTVQNIANRAKIDGTSFISELSSFLDNTLKTPTPEAKNTFISNILDTTDFSTDMLKENINGENEALTIKSICLISSFYDASEGIRRFTTISSLNSTKNAVGSDVFDTIKKEFTIKEIIEEMKGNLLYDETKDAIFPYDTYDKLIKNVSYLEPLIKCYTNITPKLLKDNFMQYQAPFRGLLQYLALGHNIRWSNISSKKLKSLFNQFCIYMASKDALDCSYSNRKAVLLEAPLKFLKLRIKNNVSNDLLSSLVIGDRISKKIGIPNIYMKTAKLSSDIKDALSSSWSALVRTPETKKISDLLINYNIFRYGFRFSPTGFLNIAPNDSKLRYGKEGDWYKMTNHKGIGDLEIEDYENFLMQYIRNNPYSSLVGTFSMIPDVEENVKWNSSRNEFSVNLDFVGDVLALRPKKTGVIYLLTSKDPATNKAHFKKATTLGLKGQGFEYNAKEDFDKITTVNSSSNIRDLLEKFKSTKEVLENIKEDEEAGESTTATPSNPSRFLNAGEEITESKDKFSVFNDSTNGENESDVQDFINLTDSDEFYEESLEYGATKETINKITNETDSDKRIKLVNKMLNSFTKKLGEDKVNKSEIFTEVKEAIKKFC